MTKKGNPYHDSKGLFTSGPHSGFKSPESIARHQARPWFDSDRESTFHGEAPSETTRKKIEALEQDIKEHGDAGLRSGGGEKAQRVKYMKKRVQGAARPRNIRA